METAAEYTRRILRTGAKAHKSLGQNFLMDDIVIDRIVQTAIENKSIPIVEVGPGLGVLTRVLGEKAEKVWAIELDKSKIPVLEKELKGLPVKIVNMNALELKLKDIWGQEKGYLIGNLPYYITSPILIHFLSQTESLLGMTVMVQREVADRLVAKPGGKDYGVLSVAVQVSAEAEKIFEVTPEAFWPAPKVTSAVVRLRIRPYPNFDVPEPEFFRVVKAAFSQRRKNLGNSLSSGLSLGKQEAISLLQKVNISDQRRAETLRIREFLDLTKAYLEQKDIK
ncbi:MAG: 16S rRNA (adenine(1518)-N(6)/adenine(1519)-N(6))-dimethyltransferase RsmA [Desulfitobacterium hafniense]|nr:16S rRNA (adenine(1518)-N(6)/adenine(1519)-N(6))-dimethyltransferase RsmA [Desulfitobacterium hafniense]